MERVAGLPLGRHVTVVEIRFPAAEVTHTRMGVTTIDDWSTGLEYPWNAAGCFLDEGNPVKRRFRDQGGGPHSQERDSSDNAVDLSQGAGRLKPRYDQS